MNILFNILKYTIQILLVFFIIKLVIKIFLKHTLIGKLLSSIVKDCWFVVKLSFKVCRYTIKIANKNTKKIYKRIQDRKEVINGNNIIEFKKYSK